MGLKTIFGKLWVCPALFCLETVWFSRGCPFDWQVDVELLFLLCVFVFLRRGLLLWWFGNLHWLIWSQRVVLFPLNVHQGKCIHRGALLRPLLLRHVSELSLSVWEVNTLLKFRRTTISRIIPQWLVISCLMLHTFIGVMIKKVMWHNDLKIGVLLLIKGALVFSIFISNRIWNLLNFYLEIHGYKSLINKTR